MAVWEIEQDGSDLQYDLLRDGAPVGYGLPDYYMVAQRLLDISAEKSDIIELPDGDQWTVAHFIAQNG